MYLGFFISGLANFIFLSVILALLDEHKRYYLERKPWFLFTMAIMLPIIMEVASFLLTGRPFLATVLPTDKWNWIFG